MEWHYYANSRLNPSFTFLWRFLSSVSPNVELGWSAFAVELSLLGWELFSDRLNRYFILISLASNLSSISFLNSTSSSSTFSFIYRLLKACEYRLFSFYFFKDRISACSHNVPSVFSVETWRKLCKKHKIKSIKNLLCLLFASWEDKSLVDSIFSRKSLLFSSSWIDLSKFPKIQKLISIIYCKAHAKYVL